jgi:hypothetical protein
LEEKKKRYLLSKSDNLANHFIVKEFKNRISNSNNTDKNESIDFISDSEFKFNETSNLNSNTDNTYTNKNSDGDNESSNNNIQILINNNNSSEEIKSDE